jgi:hypothetical protein
MKTAMKKKTALSKRVFGGLKGSVKKRGDLKITAADFERPVMYHGIKIEPIAGKRSRLARRIRDDLRKQSEQLGRKSA